MHLPLPSGHGLAAGEITVPAGGSAEHGNVVVSCPAGGGACVVTVAADGTATYDRTGGVPGVMAAYGPWSLPANHGLAAGEITVPAGGAAEHGNVVVSCPAGGGACMVTVAADGTATYDRTGGVPGVMAAYGPWSLPANHGLLAGGITVPAGGSAEHGNVVLSCPAGGGACVVTVAADGTATYDRTGGVPGVMAAYGPWSLPANHGLAAGGITVPPGSSAEHGNVVLSCPAGGGACMVTVAADGTATYDRTGGVPGVMAAYGPWSLPANHGLAAGGITVPPGGAAEHGNVVVSCPAGGGACMVTVAADGTATYDRTGGVPAVWRLSPDHALGWFDNTLAADLADHWHVTVAPDAIAAALGLTLAPAGAADRLAAIARRGGAAPPAGVEVLGDVDGITVGRWTAGPADHLPIDVDWRLVPDAFSTEVRARTARVAKHWSHRLTGTLDPYVIPRGQPFRYDPNEPPYVWPETTELHGVLLIARPSGEQYFFPSSSTDVTASSYRPRISPLWYGSQAVARPPDAWATSATIGGRLGISGSGRIAGPHQQHWDAAGGAWAGPHAARVYGGPVPFARHSDGSVDSRYFDATACPAVKALCQPRSIRPQAIDLAFLADLGYTIADEAVLDEPERYGIGAWGRASVWTLTVERELDGLEHDRLQGFADAFGIAPAQAFAEANRAADGRAVWRGFLLGADLGQVALPPVTGSARITVDLAALTGTAEFSGLRSLVAGRAEPFHVPRLNYTISVDGNQFRDADERLHGAWFGDDHAELAGTLLDTREDVNLLAAFGGSSDLDQTSSPPPAASYSWTHNATAADLADHWHRTRMVGAVGAAIGLSPLSPGDDHAMQDVLDSSGGPAAPGSVDRLSFRAVDPAETIVLGTVDGITVGRWTAGPADTLPIQVDWSLFGDHPPPPEALVRSARAARNLGRHFRDDVGEHTLAAGTVLGDDLVWPEDTTTNGLLVAMIPPIEGRPPFASSIRAHLVDGDYQPWLGAIHMPAAFYDRIAAQNAWNYDWVYSHELVHVLGIGSRTGQFSYFDREAAVWNGPNAVAVHGGPVPFRRLQDGTIDFTHVDASACPSVVTAFLACDSPASTASALDLAMLADIGYEVLDPETATDTEIYALGAWNDEAAWGVLVARDLAARPAADNRALYDHDRLTASAEAFGIEPGSSFADAQQGLTGAATWRGVLLGVDLADPALAPLTGRATVRVDLATFDARADFDGLSVLDRGIPEPFRVTDLSYDVLVTGNTFGDLDGKVYGQWYGSAHDAVAGVLDDRDPAVNVLGAFGGSR